MSLFQKLITANRIRKEKGWAGIGKKIKLLRRRRLEEQSYRKWIAKHKLDKNDRERIRGEIDDFSHKPLISIILPVYNVEEKWLRICIESVFRQIYDNWELCIADDKSPSPHIRKVLEEYAARDQRIKVVFREENGHISAASNSALEIANGEFCALLDHDDELAEDALFYVAKEINEFSETAFIYSDEDMIDEKGTRYSPNFKPDFSRDLFYSLNLITHLSVYKTEILRKIGGFRVGLEGSQDYDLALRFIEQIDEKNIRHIPRILYHWRAIQGSVALSSEEKPYAHERARAALRDHFERTGKRAKVERGVHQLHRVRYELPETLPRVSLILSADSDFNIAENIVRFLNKTDYENLEMLLICREKPGNLPQNVNVIFREDSSDAEILNQAVLHSTGEILCFANAKLLPVSKDWLKELTSFAIQKEIGAVGGKVLDENEDIKNAGIVVGFDGLIGAAHGGLPREADGNLYRAQVVNNFSALSIDCFATRREIFDEIGGFDAENLPDALFDADFCLKLGERNLRVVFTPYAELKESEKSDSSFNPSAQEVEIFKQQWQKIIERDPFYNPNLSLAGETFRISL